MLMKWGTSVFIAPIRVKGSKEGNIVGVWINIMAEAGSMGAWIRCRCTPILKLGAQEGRG